MHSNTKIICTFGQAIDSKEKIKSLIEKGMSIARMNMSHNNHKIHLDRIKMIREVEKEMNICIPIGLDTKGPELRILNIEKEFLVKKGDKIFLTNSEPKNGKSLKIHLKNLLEIKKDTLIFVDDGLLKLKVIEKKEEVLETEALNDHTIFPRKKINIPGFSLQINFLSEEDKKDLLLGLEEKVDYLFLSFVSKPSDILEVKHFLKETNKHFPLLISKIESVEGMKNLDSLIELSDGIMIARGDLGVEIGFVETFSAQNEICEKVRNKGKILICATQMLESMTNSPVPTRAEVTDIGNAVLQGVDCVMLSGETAKGNFPEQAVDLMHQVCLKAEKMIKVNNSYNDLKEIIRHFQPKSIVLETNSFSDISLILKINKTAPVFIKSENEIFKRQILIRKNCFLFDKFEKKSIFIKRKEDVWEFKCLE
ncbi:pyruvate kinase [Tubulinosema ratisbonensis]|uniref:Pyruvate kinase n=1 Tax=Tubulinosema ratisbonensis TaxID=291195 RepID=A0A437AJS9_9MICR|nr:pyruvate kinase [Tubulinosema ratisbonensis]